MSSFDGLISQKLEDKYKSLVESDYLLPLKVTDFYLKKIREETQAIGIGGPLYKTVLPTEERLNISLCGESRDYINEKRHMPVLQADYIVRKYSDRLIFLVSDDCFAHCQYCFRTYKLSSEKKDRKNQPCLNIEEKTEVLFAYLKSHPEIKEVILTGGDPLTLQADKLRFIFKKLSAWKLRLHTRAIVYSPDVIDSDILSLLHEHNVKIVFHINHPYEICRMVEDKILLMSKNNIKLYAQFPLLRGINDNDEVLTLLLEKCADLNIRPLSIFCVEPNKYSASFRLNFKRIEKIINKINWNTPSWINSVRFVLDSEIGKVRREDIIRRDKTEIVFGRDGKEIRYRDFPAEYDIPAHPDTVLWKGKGL
ncbi:MAG: 4Fe-4S cluster-binding domain-containing protein [Spirochaetaceae bacterium]|jgi:lysine 2,3-aminomutase|nr:4Fe-4S cluster-binding domain-containing protein [Spirochaetaceae bacterium]